MTIDLYSCFFGLCSPLSPVFPESAFSSHPSRPGLVDRRLSHISFTCSTPTIKSLVKRSLNDSISTSLCLFLRERNATIFHIVLFSLTQWLPSRTPSPLFFSSLYLSGPPHSTCGLNPPGAIYLEHSFQPRSALHKAHHPSTEFGNLL